MIIVIIRFKRGITILSVYVVLLMFVGCKSTAPAVVKETEVIVANDYCKVEDFILSINDLVDRTIYLGNITTGTLDNGQPGLIFYNNILYSPDKKYSVEFRFVPSIYSDLSGTCDAHVFKSDKSLFTIIKNVNPKENIIWFRDFAIFDGYGLQKARKIILDLNTSYNKQVASTGLLEFVGKSNDKAYYTNIDAGAILEKTRIKNKYSIVSLSKNSAEIEFDNTEGKTYHYYYDDEYKVEYNSDNDEFEIFTNGIIQESIKSKYSEIVFDATKFDSIAYININIYNFYKLSNGEHEQFLDLRAIEPSVGQIKEIIVHESYIMINSINKVTRTNLDLNGNYSTKNNIHFNIKDTSFDHGEDFMFYVTEIGIIDLENNRLVYPELKIVN